MIEVNQLAKTFVRRTGHWWQPSRVAVRAVMAVDFTAPDGHILGLLGPNGAGKTTSLRMVAGLIKPDHGGVRVDGFDVAKEPLSARARMGGSERCARFVSAPDSP